MWSVHRPSSPLSRDFTFWEIHTKVQNWLKTIPRNERAGMAQGYRPADHVPQRHSQRQRQSVCPDFTSGYILSTTFQWLDANYAHLCFLPKFSFPFIPLILETISQPTLKLPLSFLNKLNWFLMFDIKIWLSTLSIYSPPKNPIHLLKNSW